MDKWGNRVTKNFLYYQTNYFIVAGVLIALLALSSPWQTILGVAAHAAIFAALITINPTQVQGQPMHASCTRSTGWLYMLTVIAVVLLVLYLFEAILYVLLLLLLPFSVAFVHASLRLRNLRNKLSNTVDEQRLRFTPMGVFLEALTIFAETVSK